MSDIRNAIRCLGFACAVTLLAGCRTAGYYHQAAKGQWEILRKQRPVEAVLQDPSAPPALKKQLALATRLVRFAESDLGLKSEGNYSYYADLERPYAVHTLYAAPHDSLEPKEWWYPFVGRLSYRGYFDKSLALEYAERLKKKGYDVYIGGVRAYSTLGWFRDPILNTFIHDDEYRLAETVFHELAHVRLFVDGDADFNEAFATFVEEEGVRRWLKAQGDPEKLDIYRRYLDKKHAFHQTLLSSMNELEKSLAGLSTTSLSAMDRRQAVQELKREHFERLRKDLKNLQDQWNGNGDLSAWISGDINNARLSAVDTYYQLVPCFQKLFEQADNDLETFYRQAEDMGKSSGKTPGQALKARTAR